MLDERSVSRTRSGSNTKWVVLSRRQAAVPHSGIERTQWVLSKWIPRRSSSTTLPSGERERRSAAIGPLATYRQRCSSRTRSLDSPFISGAQRLPNGNTLICSGDQRWVFEVTPDKRVVWDWRSPFIPDPDELEEDNDDLPAAMFRAERYGAEYPGIVALHAKGAAIPAEP
ncbi:MAG: hypothetical protein ACI835_005306 [Planctomycetota bacterium]|jgi:hypothetical protein